MRARTAVLALLVVAVAGTCVRLGVWQLARRAEKHAMNVALDRALAAPPETLTDARVPAAAVRGRVVALRGAFDPGRHVLLSAREHLGEPGVHVVTPFVAAGGGPVVLVDRGWLPAPDAVTARPQQHPTADTVVTGFADTLGRVGIAGSMRLLPAAGAMLWSAERLDRDTVATRLPYAVAAFTVTELPSPAAAASLPLREPAPRHDEAMHLGYAIQWFAFAIIVLGGPAALAWSRRPRRRQP
jgi:surfeit locus 1 family protein